ncbi:MAG: 30S ribosomal protein S20 [Acidobacteria bacterium]|nr:30S ribosomal protein S20 [Acidobacteriota bacterium]
MANIKSAAKRARRSLAQRAVNRQNKSLLKKTTKAARSLKTADPADAAAIEKALSAAYSALDKSVYKGIIHKNAAARHKQRLTKLLRQGGKSSKQGQP